MSNVEQMEDREAVNARIIELLEKLNVIPILDSPKKPEAQEPFYQAAQERG